MVIKEIVVQRGNLNILRQPMGYRGAELVEATKDVSAFEQTSGSLVFPSLRRGPDKWI